MTWTRHENGATPTFGRRRGRTALLQHAVNLSKLSILVKCCLFPSFLRFFLILSRILVLPIS